MPEQKYTPYELDQFVHMFGSEEAANALAKTFIANMVRSQQEIWEPGSGGPTNQQITDMTKDYGMDMLRDFATMVIDELDKLRDKTVIHAKVIPATLELTCSFVD